MSASEPSDEVTKCQLLSKPDRYRDVRDKCRGCLIIVCAATVIKGAWLLFRLYCGTQEALTVCKREKPSMKYL